MRRIAKHFGAGFIVLVASSAWADERLAPTPPMGWNNWNHFADKIDDATVRAEADAMAANGMRDAGYVYVNIDDAWQGTRDADGTIRPNSRFPDMKALADYVHAKGLKFGIYSSPGPKTCKGYEGSYGHEAQDAKTYAAWGIDYLKYDLCSMGDMMIATHAMEAAQAMQIAAYRKMGDALRATGRPIVYSICQYGVGDVWRWGPSVGANLWRTTGDISDHYESMMFIGLEQMGLSKFSHPGGWNDPDMLEIGNGGMSDDESRTHMSLWALLAAPLLAGNDLTKMTSETLAILTNREVIAIDQDALGHQADIISSEGPLETWSRPLADGDEAVGLFNLSGVPAYLELPYKSLRRGAPRTLRNIWEAADIKPDGDSYKTLVPAHGVVLLRLGRVGTSQPIAQ
jgi:alpha-galactosidase